MITFHTPSFGDDEFHLMDLPTMHHQQQHHQAASELHQSQQSPVTAYASALPPSLLHMSAGGRTVGTTPGNPAMAPKFPPQQFDVPDITYHAGAMLNPAHVSQERPPYYSALAMAPGSLYAVSPQMSPMVSFATPHPPMSTINQSQISCQLGFKTVSPKRGSPTSASQTTSSPIRESSEDSDDSLPLSQLSGGLKRPAAFDVTKPAERKPVKKPKTPKRKKKKDPNEPQKPVSAYALFFRDTQAAIKGQNHNASFGEVSKIVASMWDGLDPDSKAEYKRRTEEAKKEYLKALAAYRASIVSQQTPQEHADSLAALQKPPTTYATMATGMSMLAGVTSMPQTMTMVSGQPPHMSPGPQHLTHMPPLVHDSRVYSQMQQGMLMNDHIQSHQPHPMMPSPEQTQLPTHHRGDHPMSNMSPPNQMSPPSHMSPPTHMLPLPLNNYLNQNNCVPAMCVRTGCTNRAIESPAWDNDYCSNDCVITHCRDAFSAWVAGRQMSYTHVK